MVAIVSTAFGNSANAQTLDESLQNIEGDWVSATRISNNKQQAKKLKILLRDVRAIHEGHPLSAEAAVWHGLVARSYMDAKSRTGYSSIAREALDAFLSAETLNPTVFGGLVYANLGALYSGAPSKFGGFGNKTKGLGYFWKAIVVDPDGLYSNYLYARMLVDEKDYIAAHDALLRASQAADSYLHPTAERARRAEIAELLEAIERRL